MADFKAKRVEGGWQYTDNETGITSGVFGNERDARADLIKMKQTQKAKPKAKKAEPKKKWDWQDPKSPNPSQGSDEVSDPLNVRSGGLLDRFTRPDTPQEIEKQQERRRIKEFWGGYKPGPGDEHYKGPIDNVEHKRLLQSPETQDRIVSNLPLRKTERQHQLEQERRLRLGEKEQITPEQAAAGVEQDKIARERDLSTLRGYETHQGELAAEKHRIGQDERRAYAAARRPTDEGELAAEKERIAMDEKRSQQSKIDVEFADQAVAKLRDPNVDFDEGAFEDAMKDAPKDLKASAREKTGDFYVDPTTGFALDLRELKKRIDRKQILKEAQLLPPSTRAQFLASKGIIKKEDIPVDPEVELKKKYYQLQIANATLKLANEKKKMSPMQEKYFDLAKTAIGNQNYYIATEMLEKAGIKDLDMSKMMEMDGKYNAKLLQGSGVEKRMKNLTGHTPEQISNKRTKVQQSLKKLDNATSGEVGERTVLLRKYGLTNSFDADNNPIDLSKVTMVNTAKEGEEPLMVNDLKLNLWTRANDPQFQALPGADIFIDQVKKIPNDISRWSPAEYDRWISETVVEMEMAGSVNNYMEYRNTLEQLKAKDSGKTLSGKKEPPEKVKTGPTEELKAEKPETSEIGDASYVEPVPEASAAEIAIDNATKLQKPPPKAQPKPSGNVVGMKIAKETAEKLVNTLPIPETSLAAKSIKKAAESGQSGIDGLRNYIQSKMDVPDSFIGAFIRSKFGTLARFFETDVAGLKEFLETPMVQQEIKDDK